MQWSKTSGRPNGAAVDFDRTALLAGLAKKPLASSTHSERFAIYDAGCVGVAACRQSAVSLQNSFRRSARDAATGRRFFAFANSRQRESNP